MRNDKGNLIVEMTTDFALMIIELAEKLEQNRKYTNQNTSCTCARKLHT
jgi:hypothetical protein